MQNVALAIFRFWRPIITFPLKNPVPGKRGSFALILLVIATSNAFGADPLPSEDNDSKTYRHELIQQANEKNLSSERYWHLLLHYRKNIFGGSTSDADGPGFFVSPKGRSDPKAELEATLERFFSNDLVGTSKQQAQCAFPARFQWLKDHLRFDPDRLRERNCSRFRNWINELSPETITFIFPSAYMNNPSSMFGHTLLRIDQKGQTDKTRILSYVINYAAEVGRP